MHIIFNGFQCQMLVCLTCFFLSVIMSVVIIISVKQQNVRTSRMWSLEKCELLRCCVLQCSGPAQQSPDSMQISTGGPNLRAVQKHKHTSKMERVITSLPNVLASRCKGCWEPGLISVSACFDSCLQAVGPFVFSGIVCLYVKCLCVLTSCALRARLTQSFRAKLCCLLSLPSVFFSHPASPLSSPLGLSLG